MALGLLLASGACTRFKHPPPVAYTRQPESPLQAPGVLQTSSDSRSFDSSGPPKFDRLESSSSSPFAFPSGPGFFQERRMSDREMRQRLQDMMPRDVTITHPIRR